MSKSGRSRDVPPDSASVRELGRKLRHKDRLLREQSILLSFARRGLPPEVGGRGVLHGREVRETLLTRVREAKAAGARLTATCQLLGISLRTVQRWRKQTSLEDRRTLRRAPPANRLSEEERQQVLRLMGSQAHQRFTPRHLVARLADQGVYVASESTMYRLLRSLRQPEPQACAQFPRELLPQHHVAHKPNHIWSWDISRLRGSSRGQQFCLYLVMDVFSRRIMGWHVDDQESGGTASRFIRRTCEEHGVRQRGLLLHSDNGGPMRGAIMRAMLRQMGVLPSFSRPRTSSDNAFSEALFRTMKSHPSYPRIFSSLEEARAWMAHFVHWYNREHPHSGISFVTPDARHFAREHELLARRNRVYELARSRRPERWSHGLRAWSPAGPSRIRAAISAPGGAAAEGDNPLDTRPTPTAPHRVSVVVTLP